MRRSTVDHVTAAVTTVLFFLIVVLPAPAAVAAGAPITMAGRLFAAGGETPLHGAVLSLKDRATGNAFVSSPTDVEGAYQLDGLSPGNFDVSVMTQDGLTYSVPDPIVIGGAGSVALSLSLVPGENPPAGSAGASGTAKKPGGKTVKKGRTMSRSARIALISSLSVVAGAVTIGLISNGGSNNNEGSPFRP